MLEAIKLLEKAKHQSQGRLPTNQPRRLLHAPSEPPELREVVSLGKQPAFSLTLLVVREGKGNGTSLLLHVGNQNPKEQIGDSSKIVMRSYKEVTIGGKLQPFNQSTMCSTLNLM